MSLWWQDFLYAFRVLFKRPGPTFLAVIALSLSIGLTTTTFSVLNGFFFKGFPHPDGPALYQVHATNPQNELGLMAMPKGALAAFSEAVPAFAETCGFFVGTINFSGDERKPERVEGTFITRNFLRVVREPLALGAGFHELPGDALSDAILISHRLWEQRYQKSRDIIGHRVRINGDYKVIRGVLPEGFVFPYYSEVWTVYDPATAEGHFAKMDVMVVGRLAPDATEAELRDQIEAATPALLAGGGEHRTAVRLSAFGDLGIYLENETSRFWSAVQIAIMVGLLLIACANVANLLLGRASARGRELAVRAALGANRRRLMAQLLSESLVLALLGSVGGLLFTLWQVDVDIREIYPEMPAWISFDLDLRVYLFVAVLVIFVALLAGILPAFQASRTNLNEMLKDGGQTSSSFRISTFTKFLTVGQIAFSCALLFSAGLATRHFLQLRSFETPFPPEDILTMRLGLFARDYPAEADRKVFVSRLLERVESLPGVESAAATSWISIGVPNPAIAFQAIKPGASEISLASAELQYESAEMVTPGYFETYSARLLAGRLLEDADQADGAPEVTVLNRVFAEKHFGSPEEAIGGQIIMVRAKAGGPPELQPCTVVGVIDNLFLTHLLNKLKPAPQLYMPLQRETPSFVSLVVRSTGDEAENLVEPVNAAVHALDPHLPPYFVRTMEDYLDHVVLPYRMIVNLFLLVGCMALFLAAVGVYSLMAFSVSLRRQEFGVRMALGARRRNLVRMILHEGLTQLGVGIALGLCLALLLGFALSRALRSIFEPDALLLSIILGVLTLATLLALLVPLRRTARLSPMEALRYE